MGKNSDGAIAYFQVSGYALMNKNCHNSSASNDIDMKLGSITKRNKRNTSDLQKIESDVMLAYFEIFF